MSPISDVELEARQARMRTNERMDFDASHRNADRKVSARRAKAIEEQTAALKEVAGLLAQILEAMSPPGEESS